MTEPVHTIAEFLAVVRKSGLVAEDRLTAAVAGWPDQSAPLPEELVRAVVDGGLLTDWQADQIRKGRHKGFLLGKYRLLRLLGAGGMSSVYLAEHTTLLRNVAIKVLPVKRVDKTSYLARFEREAREAFRLNHQNIVRTIDLDTSGAIHFIAMEFIDGVDLQAKVKQEGPLEVREAADCIRQAALGLQHAHEEGIVHRDIKPANLVVDKRGIVKILDFGLALAKSDEENASLTQTHDEKVLGTADYLAPEQARDSHVADRRSDIYALGCTLYYLLTGRAPFASGSIAERIQAHMKRPPPNLLEERPDIPPVIAELYFRMLEKHPDGRPQNAQEVADSLAAWLAATADTGLRKRPEPPRRPPRRTPGPGSDIGLSDIHLAPSFRLGGGSGGLAGGQGSKVDSGAFNFGSGSRPAAAAPPMIAAPPATSAPPAAAAEPALDFRIDTGPATGRAATPAVRPAAKPAAKKTAMKPGKPGEKPVQANRKRLEFAGLPIVFWILAGGGVLLALGLGIAVAMKSANG